MTFDDKQRGIDRAITGATYRARPLDRFPMQRIEFHAKPLGITLRGWAVLLVPLTLLAGVFMGVFGA